MLYAIGTRVRFLHTGDEGIITGTIPGGMLNVRLIAEGIEIPAFVDDLERSVPDNGKKKTIKKIDKTPSSAKSSTVDFSASMQYAILKSKGLQLVFDPVLKNDASVDYFEMSLINDTRYDCLFTLAFSLNHQVEETFNGKISARSIFSMGKMYYDELNDAPLVEVECWRITTAGTGSRLHKKLKIKAKQFFKSVRTAPILNKQVHLFSIFEDISGAEKEKEKAKKEEGLQAYTKRSVSPKANYYTSGNLKNLGHEVEEMANFSPELDLHIQNLTKNHKKLKKGEILNFQLNVFDAYINKAIRVGVDRVFIIHGVGEGKLRDAIASRLIQMRDITSFKNEFHPRYAYGATEVILK